MDFLRSRQGSLVHKTNKMKKRRKHSREEEAIRVPIEDVLDLHTFQAKEVPGLLEEYIDACLKEDIFSVRIIHGKGQGVLKKRVCEVLKKNRLVGSFSEAPGNAGGWGATIVVLKKEGQGQEWERFFKTVEEGADLMGLPIGRGQVEKFALHAKEILEWNQFANLTAITELEELAEKQFLDVVPLAGLIPTGCRVLDIGSGGGFPGIPLKVLRPDLDMVLIDGARKKANFLKHMIRTLGMKGIKAYHRRVEEVKDEEGGSFKGYDIIISKAVARLDKLVGVCEPLLGCGGRIVAMKGKLTSEEELCAKRAIEAGGFSIERSEYQLPSSGVERSIVVLRR